jgi:flagellar biosynthesis protein FlhF
MNLKRFRRETVQDALRAAREELGPGALVLSTRMVAAPGMRGWFGGRLVEVTAAADRPRVSDLRHLQQQAEEEYAMRVALERETAEREAAAREEDAREQARAAARTRKKTNDRAVASLAAQLEATGLDATLAREVAAAHPTPKRRGGAVQNLRDTLAMQLAPLAATDDDFAAVEVFVGPPGVGKTTTIAKLASQERARGGSRLGLVAADGFRVGAVEQLRLYADVLGTPLTIARTPDELELAIRGAKKNRPLLVDTAGRSPNDDVSREMMRVVAGRKNVRTHLVLAAGTSPATVRRVLARFDDAQPARLVITKLDEAESLASIVGVLREQKIPISYLATGQNVPEDLERATAPSLASWVAGDARHGATA